MAQLLLTPAQQQRRAGAEPQRAAAEAQLQGHQLRLRQAGRRLSQHLSLAGARAGVGGALPVALRITVSPRIKHHAFFDQL